MNLQFWKGHGTGNDFVIVADDDARLHLTAGQVRQLTDRHTGIGADGLLRVVPAAMSNEPDVVALAPVARWFMDYRNADGSIAEMCGNGARVFAHFLLTTGRETADSFVIATRAGAKTIKVLGDGQYSVSMGRGAGIADDVAVTANNHRWTSVGVTMPNPHAVSFVEDLAQVGDLLHQPTFEPTAAFPQGVNFEFVQVINDTHVRMRVHERGVGETQSCGTGACAAAWAARRRAGQTGDTRWQVDVPGGTVFVDETADGAITLSGPAVLVASGETSLVDHQ